MDRRRRSGLVGVVGALLLSAGAVLAQERPVDGTWLSQVSSDIAASEYEVRWQPTTVLADLLAAWQAPNRAQGFRTYVVERGIHVVPRAEEDPSREWSPVSAQESPSYRLSEHVFNAAGHPADGTVLNSAHYRVRLDSVGERAVQTGLTSPSYRMDAGFVSAYPPPGETTGLLFSDKQTLSWSSDRSAGSYDLYRDETSHGYGNCEQRDLQATTATDASTPTLGGRFFYLVTTKNRLSEEGTKGYRSDGGERTGGTELPICP